MPAIRFLKKTTSPLGYDCAGEVELWQSGRFVGTGVPEWIPNGLGKTPTLTRVLLQGLPNPYTDGEIIEGVHDADFLYVQAPVGWIYIVEAYG